MAVFCTCFPGVPWNIHCWSQTVGHAYERAQKSFLRCLLRDFQSMSADEYTNDFCDDGLVILFSIFKECEVRGAWAVACSSKVHITEVTVYNHSTAKLNVFSQFLTPFVWF